MTTILSTFIPLPSQDSVGFYNQNGNQIFTSARPLKCVVKRPSKFFTHPLETNQTIGDHKIILQAEIEMTVRLKGEEGFNTYQSMLRSFQESETIEVRTKMCVFPTVQIVDMPHEELASSFDSVIMELKLIQEQVFEAQTIDTDEAFNTRERGLQQGKEATEEETEQASTAYRLFKGD